MSADRDAHFLGYPHFRLDFPCSCGVENHGDKTDRQKSWSWPHSSLPSLTNPRQNLFDKVTWLYQLISFSRVEKVMRKCEKEDVQWYKYIRWSVLSITSQADIPEINSISFKYSLSTYRHSNIWLPWIRHEGGIFLATLLLGIMG